MKVVKKILNTLINILIVIVLVVSVLIAVFALTSKASGVSTIFGFTIQTVQSDSMKGGSDEFEGGDFEKGDVIIGKATNGDPDAEYQVGDIVTYIGILSGTDTEGLICHRIVEVNKLYEGAELTVYRTKGDNNYDSDQKDGDTLDYIAADRIKSVFYTKDYHGVVIKGLGNVLDFLQTQLGFFLVVLLPMIAFFLYELIRVIFNAANFRNEKKKEQEDEERAESEEEKQKAQQAAIDAAVAEALKKRDEEDSARKTTDDYASDSASELSSEELEQFRQFQEFKRMQEQQKAAEKAEDPDDAKTESE